jgi:hypothetical protein
MDIAPESRADLLSQVRRWCAQQPAAHDLAELEQLALEISRCVGQAVVEQGLAQLDKTQGYRGSSRECGCGRKAKFVSYRQRWVGTLFGPVAVTRAYYHCRHCHTGQVPWDQAQGLNELLWSPTVKALVAEVVGHLSYGETVALLERLSGLRLEESVAERIVQDVGGRLRAEEEALMEGYESGQVTPLVPQAPQRLYVGLDGTSAHIDGSWHEVKTGVVYGAVPDARGQDEAVAQRYVAAQEPAERFGARLYLTAAQAGVEQAAEVVVIGDGAEWIWNLADHHYPRATQIVDYWHACEHIHDLARDYYGEGNKQGKRWAQDHCRWLRERGPGTLLRALGRMKPQTTAQAEAVRLQKGYFSRNRQRMQYSRYRRRGLMIGSGPVEAGCKTVVGARLKRSGMRWSSRGADAVLAIRTALLSRNRPRIQRMAKAA